MWNGLIWLTSLFLDDNVTLGFVSCWGLLNSWYQSAADEGFFYFLFFY